MMKRFTYGTTPKDVIRENLPHKYNMDLNKSDMLNLLNVLNDLGDGAGEELFDWAMSFRTSILETIGIEEI